MLKFKNNLLVLIEKCRGCLVIGSATLTLPKIYQCRINDPGGISDYWRFSNARDPSLNPAD